MWQRRHVRTVVLVIGGLAVVAVAALADAAKPVRPPTTVESPEVVQHKQLPTPAQQVGRPSKAELLARCQQRPACRAKLEAAQKGQKPPTVRPAATIPSREELELKKLPAPIAPVTPRRFQRSGLGLSPWDWLLAWLNPFRQPVAEAQQLKPLTPMIPVYTGVSVYLTPQNPYVATPTSALYLWGVTLQSRFGYWLDNRNSTFTGQAESKPYVFTLFRSPAAGWYVIDHRASSAATKLNHGPGAIVDTWDVGSAPCSAGICDYATMEYLQPGEYHFYFYSPTHGYYFYSVSIESYP